MTQPTYDQPFWEELWTKTLREHATKVAQRQPHAQLIALSQAIPPGRALDAGCGHGAETLWLAAHGWQVTALDFSRSALNHGRAMAEAASAELAARIDWVEADLATWSAPPDRFDLIVNLYVHVAGSLTTHVRQLARSVAPGGALFMVGHRPIDPATGGDTAAAGQSQITVEAAREALDPDHWELIIAQELPRTIATAGVDAVIWARRIG